MRGKAITAITLAAFVLASASCMMWKTMNINETTQGRTRKFIAADSDLPGKSAKIMSLVMASGERIDFSNSGPGRVRGLVITGTAARRLSVPIEIQGPFSSIKKCADGTVYEITDRSGRAYPVQRVLKEGDAAWSILINDRTVQPVSILLSDVRQVRFKQSNPPLTFLAIVAPSLGMLYLYLLASLDH